MTREISTSVTKNLIKDPIKVKTTGPMKKFQKVKVWTNTMAAVVVFYFIFFRRQYLKIPMMIQMTRKNVAEKKKNESNKKIFERPQKLQKQNPLSIAQVTIRL